MAQATWYRLDNIGKFYAAQAGDSNQTVFRYAATLVDDIDAGILQHALDKTVETFPSFNVCLRSGFFWHYLEQSPIPPHVTEENLPVCFGLHANAKSILFRVSYYRARINLEVSHMISDGRGTLNFFRALISTYIQERYGLDEVPSTYDGSDSQKAENSFDKYYEKDKAAPTHTPKVFHLRGWRDASDPTFLEYHLPVHRVLELSHAAGVSLNSFITAAAICAIREEMPQRERNRAIRFDIPVDLRSYFESSTVKNFFGLAYASYAPGDTDESLEEVAAHVQAQIKAATQAEALKARMNRMIAMEKNPFLRLAPLLVKDAALELVSRWDKRNTTATVSNLSAIRLADEVAPYIRDIDVMTSSMGLNFLLCSFGDDLSISISTVYANLDVAKNFCRIFSERGIEGRINSNKADTSLPTAMAAKTADDKTARAAAKSQAKAKSRTAKEASRAAKSTAKAESKAAKSAAKAAKKEAGKR